MPKSTWVKYIAQFVVFATVSYAQTYKVLYTFGTKAGDPSTPSYPGTIAQSRGGAMMSTAGNGAAFRITTGGSLNVLHRFGVWSSGGLNLATDGRYYGTTESSGTYGLGTVFKMTQGGAVTTLHEFTGGTDGGYPRAAPIQSVEGDFYGTTAGESHMGQLSGNGTIYRITKYGNFTLLYTFTGADGMLPTGQLVQGTDFYFYGTTYQGGSHNAGTIFRFSSTGDFKVLVNFDLANGASPSAGLIQANDGNFYGVTQNGGSSGYGVLFRMKPNGTITVLHNFTGGSDGMRPSGGLVQASDGNLYGTAIGGGTSLIYGQGVLFRSSLAGDFVTLHEFDGANGSYPESTLLQHTNGDLYGDTLYTQQFSGGGVFYSLDVGLRPFVTYLPTYGRPGALVQILGQGFTADSKVSFKGTPATSPVVVYPTYIRVIVPAGATTGPITVTTSSGTLTSNKVFIVHR